MLSPELEERFKNLNGRLLNLTFQLSFNRKLSRDNQEKLRKIEKSLNDNYFSKKV